MSAVRIGSLFTGAGGLDMAVEQVYGGRVVWTSENAPGPAKVLAHRFPGVPNLGDITLIDWARSNLWVAYRDAIALVGTRERR